MQTEKHTEEIISVCYCTVCFFWAGPLLKSIRLFFFFLTLMFMKTTEFNNNQSCKLVINSVTEGIKIVVD